MNKKIFITVLLAAASLFATEKTAEPQTVQANNIRLAVGLGYRKFDAMSFKAGPSISFKGIKGNEVELQNYDTGKFLIEASNYMDVAEVVYYDGSTTSSSAKLDSADCFSLYLSGAYQVWEKEAMSLSLIAGFQYFDIGVSTSAMQGAEFSTYQTKIPGLPLAPERDPHDTEHLRGAAQANMNLSLYVFDLGLRGDYSLTESLSAFASFGPSLSVADMESSSKIWIRGNNQYLASARTADNSVDFIFGYYVAAGVQYKFAEHIGTSMEFRYDDCFAKASTAIASQKLDGFGGVVKVTFDF